MSLSRIINQQNRKWWILAAVAPCLAMSFLDQTAVAVMLPQLHRDLGVSEIMQQWVVNAYLLSLSVLTVFGGKLSDILGNRKAFFLGIIGFLLFSSLCGFAPNGGVLVASRALQGAFAAILLPNLGLVIIKTFPKGERGTAMGIYASSAAVFLAVGPLFGGFLTEFLSWRFVFWVNLPLGIFSIIIAWLTLPNAEMEWGEFRFDWLGFALIGIASASLIIMLMHTAEYGWLSPFTISLLLLAIFGYAGFIFVEKHIKHPLVDLTIFKEKNYLFATMIIVCVQFVIMTRVFWSLFFQMGLGYSPLWAGLLVMPSTACNMIFAQIYGRMLDRYGPRPPIIIGLSIMTAGMLWVSFFASSLNYLQILVGTILVGIGLSTTTNLFTTALTAFSEEKRGVAYGMYNQIRQLGGAFSVAVMGSVITNFDNRFFQYHLKQVNLTVPVKVDDVLNQTPVAVQTLSKLPHEILLNVHNYAVIAYAHAFQLSMLIAGSFSLLGLVLAITKLDKNKSKLKANATTEL
jgi:EmrB/QacA subfamily drug resistance transporter